MQKTNEYQSIPAVDEIMVALLQKDEWRDMQPMLLVKMVRVVTAKIRSNISAGNKEELSFTDICEQIEKYARGIVAPASRRTINATGLVLHTNLGRAPLSQGARELVQTIMEGYSALEFELSTGNRGSRYKGVVEKIKLLTGAEEALIVNNNAAAVLLAIASVAKGREVIVSRGQLVEIGGSFRIPEVIQQSGAKMIEVGSTNKTHLEDYRNAITAETIGILKVHTSNYVIKGFVDQPSGKSLCELASKSGLISIMDLGSGALSNVYGEPTVQETLQEGFDIVTYSCDKLMGGGQAGIIAGKAAIISEMKRHPLLRALRVDKLSLAALEGTLLDYIFGDPQINIPALQMIHRTTESLVNQATAIANQLKAKLNEEWRIHVVETINVAGGGSLPEVEFP